MKCLAILSLCLLPTSALADEPDAWLRIPNFNKNEAKLVRSVPRELVFEVPVSMLDAAVERLRSRAIEPLKTYDVENFSRSHFSCPPKTTAYLVRAVFENGSTGGYELQQIDSALWVSHNSLGAATGKHRSALLACLFFSPAQVFVTSSGAM